MSRQRPVRRARPAIMALVGGFATLALAAAPSEELLRAAAQAFRRGDQNEALRLATAAADGDPQNADCQLALATLRDARREFDQAVACYARAIQLRPESTRAYEARGEDLFRLGRFPESVADFDKVIALEPDRAPHHWQRGISLYYAGEFERGARQFELHKTVNPEDVENAVWHYLCVAKTDGVQRARSQLIDIHRDSRIPLMRIYALFKGEASPEDVLQAAKAGEPSPAELRERLFYASLYVGLYLEANNRPDAAKEHFALAEKYADNGYMGDVARVQLATFARRSDTARQ